MKNQTQCRSIRGGRALKLEWGAACNCSGGKFLDVYVEHKKKTIHGLQLLCDWDKENRIVFVRLLQRRFHGFLETSLVYCETKVFNHTYQDGEGAGN